LGFHCREFQLTKRTNPLGTTVLYSNQSQTNLLLKIAAASTFISLSQATNFVLLENSAVGAQNAGQKQSILYYLVFHNWNVNSNL
jgi:hypothetical protein